MAAKRLNAEVLLKEIALDESLALETDTRHLLSAALVWPRPLIARRTALLEVALTGGRHDFSSGPWNRRILFKETLQGNFALGLVLSEALGKDDLAKLLVAFADPLLQGAVRGIDAAAGAGSLPAGLLSAPFAYFAKEGLENEEPRPLAEGTGDVHLEELEAARTAVIPLKTVRAVTRPVRVRRGDRIRTVRRTIVPAEQSIGTVSVAFRLV